MTAAITMRGCTFLLLSAMYAQNIHARVLSTPDQQASTSAPAGQTPAAPQSLPPSPPAPQVAPSLLQQPAGEAQILFSGDSLTIHADNSSLDAILHQIAAKSGMEIEGLGADERVFGSFGPGAPRDVLADLLNGTAYNLVLLGDLSNGAPRQLILTPATRGGATTPSPAPPVQADEASNEPEVVETPPPQNVPPPGTTPPPGSTPPGAPGVKTPQELFEQLQHMRQTQQQNPDQQNPPQPAPQQ
jgi:hypothetical protein